MIIRIINKSKVWMSFRSLPSGSYTDNLGFDVLRYMEMRTEKRKLMYETKKLAAAETQEGSIPSRSVRL